MKSRWGYVDGGDAGDVDFAGQRAVGRGLTWCLEMLLARSEMKKTDCDKDLRLATVELLCRKDCFVPRLARHVLL